MATAATVAAARFLHFSALRLRHKATTTIVHSSPPRLPPKAVSSSFSTASLGSVPAPAKTWPEWEDFLEQLTSRGYLDGEEWGAGSSGSGSFDDYGRLKAACLAFARDRPHLLRSLPRKDIQAVVECGCPNLLRKSVNSAKRLREYVNLDEGNVCSTCSLRESCDRAYVLAKESEGARTVDIMRVLLQHAAQSLPNTNEYSRVKDSAEESARRLLSELISLCDRKPDPEIINTVVKPQTQEKLLFKKTRVELHPISRVNKNRQRQNVEMKRGDWICTRCNFLNFARNLHCLECKADRPMGDNLSSPKMKKGDWTCPQCQVMNFASRKECRRCQGLRPQRVLEPGEWECPSCDFLNFRKNRRCLKCNCDRPKDDSSSFKYSVWRPPKLAYEDSKLLGLAQ